MPPQERASSLFNIHHHIEPEHITFQIPDIAFWDKSHIHLPRLHHGGVRQQQHEQALLG